MIRSGLPDSRDPLSPSLPHEGGGRRFAPCAVHGIEAPAEPFPLAGRGWGGGCHRRPHRP